MNLSAFNQHFDFHCSAPLILACIKSVAKVSTWTLLLSLRISISGRKFLKFHVLKSSLFVYYGGANRFMFFLFVTVLLFFCFVFMDFVLLAYRSQNF